LITNEDLDFGGNFSQTINGVMSAKEQTSLTGTCDLNGLVIAADAASVSNVVTSNVVGGNFSITLNGNIVTPFLSNKVILLS
jgi:hypothetical protein